MGSDVESLSADEESREENSTQSAPESRRKSAYYFKDTDDISLLREVLVEKPVGKDGPQKWKEIFDRMGLPVKDYRAIQSRFYHLLSCFKTENFKSIRGSGLEENYDEKMRLLTDIVSQLEDWEKEDGQVTAAAKRKQDESQSRAQSIREAALVNLEGTETANAKDPAPKRAKRCKPVDVLEILAKSEEKDKAHQETLLEIEKKKLELRDKELDNQIENDRHRRELETKKLEMEQERMKLELERQKNDAAERNMLFQLLSKKV